MELHFVVMACRFRRDEMQLFNIILYYLIMLTDFSKSFFEAV